MHIDRYRTRKIYSSSEPFSEERVIDFKRLYNWLSFYRFEICGFKCKEPKGSFQLDMETGYHCSGHLTTEETERIVREIKPAILIPVHTTCPRWFKSEFGKECNIITDL